MGTGLGCLPSSCLWEILKRLPPPELLAAAAVCKRWREAAKMIRNRVPARAQVGLDGSVLQKFPGLVKMSLKMESDVDATLLAWITFSAPNLEFLEISTAENVINRITGDELSQFVADGGFLKSLKMEGCSNLGGFSLCSSSLCTIWLSGLQSLTEMVFNCPNLEKIALDFSAGENDRTDLVTMVDALGSKCPRLQSIYIASVKLSNAVALALTAAHFRELRMLSLVRAEITSASVDAISSSYPNLELLDLSGSSIIEPKRHGTTIVFLFLKGGNVLVGVDTRTTETWPHAPNPYITLNGGDEEDSYEVLNAGVDEEEHEDDYIDEEEEENEGIIGEYEKHHIFKNKVFAAFAGNCDTWEKAVESVTQMIEIFTENGEQVSPIMVANKFKLHLKRSCKLIATGKICGDTDVLIVGFDSKQERVRVFVVSTTLDNMILKEYTRYDVDAILGSGKEAVGEYICLGADHELGKHYAHSLLKEAMLRAAIKDGFTGSMIKFFQVTPELCGNLVFSATILRLYLGSFSAIDNENTGLLVVLKKSDEVSKDELVEHLKILSGRYFFRGEKFIIHSHILGEAGQYTIRRVLFKDPSYVRKLYWKMTREMGDKPILEGLKGMPCTQLTVRNKVCYVYARKASKELLRQILRLAKRWGV